jgi:hypothetical protein
MSLCAILIFAKGTWYSVRRNLTFSKRIWHPVLDLNMQYWIWIFTYWIMPLLLPRRRRHKVDAMSLQLIYLYDTTSIHLVGYIYRLCYDTTSLTQSIFQRHHRPPWRTGWETSAGMHLEQALQQTDEARSWYNNDTAYADLILELHDGRSIKVHKAILNQAGRYFDKICDEVGVTGVSIRDSVYMVGSSRSPVANRIPRTRTARLSANST